MKPEALRKLGERRWSVLLNRGGCGCLQRVRVDDGEVHLCWTGGLVNCVADPLGVVRSIFVSMMEIYGDEVLDLLSANKKKIIPREDAKKKVWPHPLIKIPPRHTCV